MNKLKYICIILIACLAFATKAQTNEYLIKAGFIEKFANFTEWPNISKNKEIEIAILGKSPFANELEELYSTRTIKNLPVKIRYIKSLGEIKNSNILFICDSEGSQLTNILNYTQNKPILTISESKGFAKRGVHINFYQTNQGTIHFEINAQRVKKSGLSIDVILLDYAHIVN